jgi:hypothetical protein
MIYKITVKYVHIYNITHHLIKFINKIKLVYLHAMMIDFIINLLFNFYFLQGILW